MAPVVIALGSNVGNSLQHLRRATEKLRTSLDVEKVSSVYLTAPMYVRDQPPFLNAVLTARGELGPRRLLALLKEIELEIGRENRGRFGPREIDLDLIAYGALSFSSNAGERPLTVPHPKVAERRFVLVPLCEIAPEFLLAGLGSAAGLLARTKAMADDVVRVNDAEL